MLVKNESKAILSEIEIKEIIASYIRGNYNLGVNITSENVKLVGIGSFLEAHIHGYFDEDIKIKE